MIDRRKSSDCIADALEDWSRTSMVLNKILLSRYGKGQRISFGYVAHCILEISSASGRLLKGNFSANKSSVYECPFFLPVMENQFQLG